MGNFKLIFMVGSGLAITKEVVLNPPMANTCIQPVALGDSPRIMLTRVVVRVKPANGCVIAEQRPRLYNLENYICTLPGLMTEISTVVTLQSTTLSIDTDLY